jgi:hypothetical protein
MGASILQGKHYVSQFFFAYVLTFAWQTCSVIPVENAALAQSVNYRLAMVDLLTQRVQF